MLNREELSGAHRERKRPDLFRTQGTKAKEGFLSPLMRTKRIMHEQAEHLTSPLFLSFPFFNTMVLTTLAVKLKINFEN